MDDKQYLEVLDASHDAQKLMHAVTDHLLSGEDYLFYKARGMSDAFLSSMFKTIGKADTKKIIDGMREQLAMMKED